jgi:hypothetical protein
MILPPWEELQHEAKSDEIKTPQHSSGNATPLDMELLTETI